MIELFIAAAFVLSVYDWAIVFADELELVGRSRRSLGKVLYYFVSELAFCSITTASDIETFIGSDNNCDWTCYG
jgi:hypothetical protein